MSVVQNINKLVLVHRARAVVAQKSSSSAFPQYQNVINQSLPLGHTNTIFLSRIIFYHWTSFPQEQQRYVFRASFLEVKPKFM